MLRTLSKLDLVGICENLTPTTDSIYGTFTKVASELGQWFSTFLVSGTLYTTKNNWRLQNLLFVEVIFTDIYYIRNKNWKMNLCLLTINTNMYLN